MSEGYPVGKEKLSEDEVFMLLEAFMNTIVALPSEKIMILRKKAGFDEIGSMKKLKLNLRLKLGTLLSFLGLPTINLSMDDEMERLFEFLMDQEEDKTAELFLRIRTEQQKRVDFDPESLIMNHAETLIRTLTSS